jgi:hypothetical protein
MPPLKSHDKKLGMVAQAYNPRGRDREDSGSRPDWAKSSTND